MVASHEVCGSQPQPKPAAKEMNERPYLPKPLAVPFATSLASLLLLYCLCILVASAIAYWNSALDWSWEDGML